MASLLLFLQLQAISELITKAVMQQVIDYIRTEAKSAVKNTYNILTYPYR